MNFFTFLIKKNGKKKLNIILLLLVIFFITFMYKGEINVAYTFENTENREQELAGIEQSIKGSEEWLDTYEKGSETYNLISKQLDILQKEKKYHEIRSQSLLDRDWKSYYEADAKLIDLGVEFNESVGHIDEEMNDVNRVNKKFALYMAENGSYFETRFGSIHGFSFLVDMINNYFPLIFAILIVFLASNLYCSSYVDRIDVHKTLPLSKFKKLGSKMLANVALGFGLFIFFATFILLYAGVIEGIGTIHSPVLTYTLKGDDVYVSFMTLLPQLALLGTLVVLFIINTVSVISTFLKRNIVCLLFSLAVILGGMWVTTNIVPLYDVAHLFPTTYFNSLQVISGEMMFTLGNANINFINGVIVLTISNLVLMAAYYFFCDFSWKKKEKVMVVSNESKETYHNDKATKGIWGYIKFTSKRVLCRKSNIVMILLTVVVAVVFLLMNMGNQSKLEETIKGQIINNEKYIQEVQKEQSEHKKGSAEYINYGNLIKDSKNDNEDYKKVLSSIEKEDWETVYTLYPKILERQISMIEQSNGIDQGAQYFQQQIAYFEYLQEHDLAYENVEFPIYGLSFTTSLTKIILPIILTICCIYLLAQFFTLDYVKGLDISVLYPLQSKKTFLTKLMLGIVFTVAMYSVLLLSILLITTLFTGNAGLQQPFMLQNSEGVWQAVSMISMFKKWFFLGVLFTINLSIFVYILSFLIREDMFVLITALLVILGFVYLPKLVGGIAQYAHLFPTTYMDSVNVADGFLAQQYGNTSISISTGVSVLLVSIVVQFIICIVLNNAYKLRKIRKR